MLANSFIQLNSVGTLNRCMTDTNMDVREQINHAAIESASDYTETMFHSLPSMNARHCRLYIYSLASYVLARNGSMSSMH